MKKNNQTGFTIIELMIATTIFSVILLVASTGVIAIGRMYYKNITSSRVQETARSMMEDVSSSLQFSQGLISYATAGNLKARCFGDDRYTYIINQQGPQGLRLDKKPDINCTPNPVVSGKELLGDNMRLLQFDVSNGADGIFQVSIKVAYGNNDQLTPYNDDGTPAGGSVTDAEAAAGLCKPNAGSFCSVSGLATSVSSRINLD